MHGRRIRVFIRRLFCIGELIVPKSEAAFQEAEEYKARMRGMGLVVVLLIATAALSNGTLLMTRKLWMDEIHSWLIVTDNSTSHAMMALADGADFNPPSWFLVTRAISSVAGPQSEKFLRILSAVWMLSAMAGLYLILARLFDWKVSLAAVVLTASHPLIIHQSTEIRYYGFWCSCVVWLCCVLQWNPESSAKRRLQWLLIVGLSLLTATSHWFGILSLGLVAMPLVIRQHADERGYARALVILGSGITGVCACLPFLYGQKAAISRPTWISPATVSDSLQFLNYMFPAWQILLCSAAAVAGVMLARKTTEEKIFRSLPKKSTELLPCASLALMPLVIVFVAWVLQPSLVARYAIVGVFGLAPVFATLLHQAHRKMQHIMIVLSLAGFSYAVFGYGQQWNDEQRYLVSLLQQLRNFPDDATIIFEDRIVWMPLKHHYPELAAEYRLADFNDSDLSQDSALRIVQRDTGRRIEKWYPEYRMQTLETLKQRSKFYVVPYADQKQPGLKYPASFSVSKIAETIVQYRLPIAVRSEGDANSRNVSTPEERSRISRRNSIPRKNF